jgi:hypothetical protein
VEGVLMFKVTFVALLFLPTPLSAIALSAVPAETSTMSIILVVLVIGSII